MLTLNDITQKHDNKTFNHCSISDLKKVWEKCNEKEREQLKKRKKYIEGLSIYQLCTRADGFTYEKYDLFIKMSLFDELSCLRSMIYL